ncbi:HupE/UreJ family protein [Rurimicrobium arvi]
MPHSVMLLDVKEDGIRAELQWPLKEFDFVFPDAALDSDVSTLVARRGAWLDHYLLQHMRITDNSGRRWSVRVLDKNVLRDEQFLTGTYNELVFHLWLQPPGQSSPRSFTLYYDAVMHQLITHKMMIRIRQDWDGGLSGKDSAAAELGMLMVNPSDNSVPPVVVNLDEGSKWKGFRQMFFLGMEHIADGTDHLMFLLALLLPAPLIASGGRWCQSGGARYAVRNLLKIVTAFTIGHSLTLLAGALGWLRLPAQPVEVLIALSVLIGCIHALRPLFPGKELFIAGGFGLIHGLAFAGTLYNLDIDGTRMALSILGFNLGIEIMQLFVVLLVVPWLILLGPFATYGYVRTAGALFGVVASLAWITERVSGNANEISAVVSRLLLHARWMILLLAVLALFKYVRFFYTAGHRKRYL